MRPRLFDDALATVTVRLPPKRLAEIERAASLLNMTRTEYLRALIETCIDERRVA